MSDVEDTSRDMLQSTSKANNADESGERSTAGIDPSTGGTVGVSGDKASSSDEPIHCVEHNGESTSSTGTQTKLFYQDLSCFGKELRYNCIELLSADEDTPKPLGVGTNDFNMYSLFSIELLYLFLRKFK